MKKLLFLFALLFVTLSLKAQIPATVVQETIRTLRTGASDPALLEKGVTQVARLWQAEDGTAEEFQAFCQENHISDPVEKERTFLKVSDYLEAIYGYYNQMAVRLQWNITIDDGPLDPIDERFAAFSPSSHLSEDLYNNKIAFLIALNFPQMTLAEKEALGSDRLAWAYARLGDLFTERIPASVHQHVAAVGSDADLYIAAYNIFAGHLLNQQGKRIFPEEMVLLSHWNLRDEIKANYNQGEPGLDKQRTIYQVMKRIIGQDIPQAVINSGDYEWNPYTNEVFQNGRKVAAESESTVRYQKMLHNFHAMQRVDEYTGDTYIDRNFNDDMEMALDEVEALFTAFLSAPELQATGRLISERLGRPLEAYDIWYDGFKARSNLDESKLDQQTRALYPDASAFERDIPNILKKLGFATNRAQYIAEKITVDPARGSGHAWGAAMKGQPSRLRTRVPAGGMDYKGYNIAVHELGHNVEQTISLYDMDYYMLNGVPNTSFTEALAFVFQKRDLDLLDITNNDPEAEAMDVLDKVWSLYEICGVSMLDIAVWKWMYAHPEATALELRDAVIELSKSIWNEYYAPVYGVKDETVLAIYSHMIGYPLYLSAYAFGQIIEFQLESYLSGKDFAAEVSREYEIGRLTPTQWMLQATGQPLSVTPMLEAVRKAIR